MKQIMTAVLLTMAMAICADTDLMRFVPGNVMGMAWIDITKGWHHPMFQRMRSSDPSIDQQCRLLENKLAQYKMRPEDAIKNMAVFYRNQSSVGSVFYTTIAEPQFDKMLANGITKGAENTVQVQKKSSNGYNYYLVKSQFKGKRLPDSGFTYVGPNQVLMAPVEQLDSIRESIAKGSIAGNKQYLSQVRMINTNAPFWTVFTVPAEVSNAIVGNAAGGPAAQYIGNISNGAFSVDMKGKTNRDFMVTGFVTCRDVGVARQMAQQLQLMPLACNDTSTAARVSESLSVTSKGNTVFMRIMLPENMQNMLLGGMMNQQMAAKSTPTASATTTATRPSTVTATKTTTRAQR